MEFRALEIPSAAAFRCPGMWLAEGVNWYAAAMKNRQRARCASVLWRDDPDCIAATTWEFRPKLDALLVPVAAP